MTCLGYSIVLVKLGVCKLHIWCFLGGVGGGDGRTHNLPLTGIYKGIFAQVPAYAWFYKSENFCAYAKSSFFAQVHFRMNLQRVLYMRPQVLISGINSIICTENRFHLLCSDLHLFAVLDISLDSCMRDLTTHPAELRFLLFILQKYSMQVRM